MPAADPPTLNPGASGRACAAARRAIAVAGRLCSGSDGSTSRPECERDREPSVRTNLHGAGHQLGGGRLLPAPHRDDIEHGPHLTQASRPPLQAANSSASSGKVGTDREPICTDDDRAKHSSKDIRMTEGMVSSR